MKSKLLVLFLILFIELLSIKLSASTPDSDIIVIDSLFTEQNLAGLVQIYASNNLFLGNDFYAKKEGGTLTQLDSDNFFPGMADKFYWVVLKFKNIDKVKRSLILEVNNPLVDSIFFYEVKSKSEIILLSENGDEIPFHKRTMANELPVFSIDIDKDGSKSYLLMLRKRKNIKFPLKIYDKSVFKIQSRKKMFFYSLYFGNLLLIFVISVFVGFFTRIRLLISYALYTFSIGAYLFADSGYAFEFLYPNTSGFNSAVRVPLSMMFLMSFMFFTSQFLEIKKHYKKINKLFLILALVWAANYLLTLPFLWIFTSAYHSYILVSNYTFVNFSLLLMIFAVVKMFKKNKSKALPYLFAVSMLIAGGALFYLAQFGFSKTNITYLHPFMLASIGELSVFSVLLFLDLRKINKERSHLLLITAQQEQDILTAQIKGNEAASLRISSELHDNIGSRLALIKNKLLNSKNNNKEISKDVGTVYDNVRDISHRLSSNSFNMLGWEAAIEEYLDEVNHNNKSGVQTSFYFTVAEDFSDYEITFQVFRIVQEAVLNCVKYAGKTEVSVKINSHNKVLHLSIEDNGKGFDIASLELNKGIGLQNIEMRTKLLKAELLINSEIDKGTLISIKIPIPN